MGSGYRKQTGLVSIWCVVSLCLLALLSACSTSDDEGETPTSIPAAATVPPKTPLSKLTPASTTATKPSGSASLTDANAQTITDGVCQALIPDGWVDDGTGRGTTSSGARFVLFGGRVATDAGWTSAADIVATPGAGKTIAKLDRTENAIHVTYADDRGFEYRARFDGKYCDFSVSSQTKPIPADEQTYWDAIIASLKPVS